MSINPNSSTTLPSANQTTKDNHQATVVMSVDSDVVDLTLSDAKKPHPCFNVVYKGRREICGIKNQKQKVLLINKVLDLNPTSFLPANIANREDVKAWFDKHKIMAKTRWNSEIVATALSLMTFSLKHQETKSFPRAILN